jgi:hypothetical protein
MNHRHLGEPREIGRPRGESFRPAGPSPAPVVPWQEAQFCSYTVAPRPTISLVLGSGLVIEL